jgi:hypothetical protein
VNGSLMRLGMAERYVGPGLNECPICFAVLSVHSLKKHATWHLSVDVNPGDALMECPEGCLGDPLLVRNGSISSTLCPSCGKELVGA